MTLRKLFGVIIIGISVIIGSILFAQVLGGYYIYNLLTEDNLQTVNNQKNLTVNSQPIEKKKVLRLEPIKFYTLQLGIYTDAQSTQQSINKLVGLGLRPFVTSKAPYKVWLGCFSNYNSGKELQEFLQKNGFEAFIGESLINDKALKFPDSNIFMKELFAPVIGKYSIILEHSLKMFKSPYISDYKKEMWEEMIKKLQDEINSVALETDKIIKQEEGQKFQQGLQQLKEKAVFYGNSLNVIKNTMKDEAVLQSQGHLLELIAIYHRLIINTNEILGTGQ